MGLKLPSLISLLRRSPLAQTTLATSAIFLLTACQIGTKIEVRNINVSEGRGEPGNPNKWSLIQNYVDVQSGKNTCNNVFIFGKPVKGYAQNYDERPLEPGKIYHVSISGGGLTGERTFVASK